ncbi:hypothetical protein ACXAT3_002638 [Clostridium sporogenes]
MGVVKHHIGDIINDYKLVDKNKKNKRILYTIQCIKCNNIRTTANLSQNQTTHNSTICKDKYIASFIGNIFEDYICIDAYMDKRLFLVLKCSKCGIERTVAEKDLKRIENKHGQTCSKNLKSSLKDFDETIYQRLKKKHANMLTRITNPKYHHYEKYKNYDCDYKYFCDFALDFYEEFAKTCNKIGIDNVYIDRINNSKGYIKGNIRFVDAQTSAVNRDIQTKFSINGMIYNNATLAAKHIKVSHSYLSRMLQKTKYGESFKCKEYTIIKLK